MEPERQVSHKDGWVYATNLPEEMVETGTIKHIKNIWTGTRIGKFQRYVDQMHQIGLTQEDILVCKDVRMKSLFLCSMTIITAGIIGSWSLLYELTDEC